MRLGRQKSKSEPESFEKDVKKMVLGQQKSKSESEKKKKISEAKKIPKLKKKYLEVSERILSDSETKGKGLKIMIPDQLLTRLPILLAHKKAGNNSQELNNEIRQIIYSLYSSKNMLKTVYNHLMNSIKRMDTISINTEMVKPMNHINLDYISQIN